MPKKLRKAPLTADEIVAMMNDYRAGMTIGDLEAKYLVSKFTVNRLRKELGVGGRTRRVIANADLIPADAVEKARKALAR